MNSNALKNYILTKENCLSLSNQTDSLLVSSSIRASTHGQMSNVKKQKRLNSERLQKDRKRSVSHLIEFGQSGKIQSERQINKVSQITIGDCIPQQQSKYSSSIGSRNNHNNNLPASNKDPSQSCINCNTQLPIIRQKLSKTVHRIQQLQTLVKLCFSKTMSVQSLIKQNSNEILDIRVRIQESEKVTKKHQQVLIKSSVSKGMEYDEIKQVVQKLGQKMGYKTKQIDEVIQLEKAILNQKIQKLSMTHQQRIETLIQMVQQLAKTNPKPKPTLTNNKVTNKHYINEQLTKTQSKLQKFQQPSSSLQQPFFSLNSYTNKQPLYHTQRRQQRNRPQSKSKISYYLSKSNFNDATTLCDTMLNPLDNIMG